MGKTAIIVAVTGANSGLGKAIVEALINQENSADIHVISLGGPESIASEGGPYFPCDLTTRQGAFDASWEIKGFTQDFLDDNELRRKDGEEAYDDYYPILVNCAGVNYIDWFTDADFDQFDRLMALNVKGALQLVQNLIGPRPALLDHDEFDWFNGTGAILNIVSNASHVPMTNSVFYNASKGAAHIATLALARELRKSHGICVFGISPNKLSGTGMSEYIEARVPDLRGWTAEQAAQYQLNALPAGEETDPKVLAEFIAYLLSDPIRHKYLTNTILPYGA